MIILTFVLKSWLFSETKKVAGPSKEDLAKIVVDNPLGLPDDDPLIIAAKTRKWEEQRI